MDRNSAIGLVLISAILFTYFQFFAPTPQPVTEVPSTEESMTDTTEQTEDEQSEAVRIVDSLTASTLGIPTELFAGEEQLVTLENKELKVFLSTRGGSIKKVMLKNYFTSDKRDLYLVDETFSSLNIEVPINGNMVNLKKLNFAFEPGAAGSGTMKADAGNGKYISFDYALEETGFLMSVKPTLQGFAKFKSGESVAIDWKDDLQLIEYDMEESRIRSTVNYRERENGLKDLNATSKDPETAETTAPVDWFAFKQKFFTVALLSEKSFAGGKFGTSVNANSPDVVKSTYASTQMPAEQFFSGEAGLRFYFGPNDYHVMKKVADDFSGNVYLGWPVVNLFNKYVIIPIFNLLEMMTSNYGVIILLLVFIIKLALLPLSFKSYVSMAKMRVLKPELDKIKEETGGDMQKMQQEQLKLYQQVGVNPISGCVPILLQMPILLAMFNFFPNSIELRGQSFLWAHDLSSYDVIARLPFTIPFYGSHVSLFTLLMTASTLVYTWLNNQVSSVQGPMQTVSYVMPLVFMFVLNSLPAGLSYYYFVSNMVTIGQQYLIRYYVDDEKIREKLENNKRTAGTRPKNKFSRRIEEALRAQEESKKTKKK